MANDHDPRKVIARVIAKAWVNEAFRLELERDAATVLRREGLAVRPGARVQVVEDGKDLSHFILPPRPPGLVDGPADVARDGRDIEPIFMDACICAFPATRGFTEVELPDPDEKIPWE
jgi:hypothetical protein